MEQLIQKMKTIILNSEPNIYYDEMMAVIRDMELEISTPKPVIKKPVAKATKPSTTTTTTSTEE
jgi:hypothetical protein